MRGVIMETKNGRAVLLTKGGEFVNVKNKGYSVGDKVNITSNTGRLCAIAASFVIVCAGIGSYFVPAGYVSVDINPSLMMTLNPYNRVIAVETFNDDARTLLSKTDIKGKSAEQSVEMLIKASEEIGYINDNNRDVILEVVPGIIKPNMEKIQHVNIELTNELADRETLRRAQDIGVSMAKVKAIEEYTEKNGGDILSNAAKFNDKSAKEMRAIMRDNGHLSDKKEPEASAQERKAEDIAETPKPQQNKHQDYKPTKNTSVRAENKTPQTSPVLNKPPIWDIENIHTDNTPTVNQPHVKEEKPKEEAFEQNKPNRGDSGSTEKLPQTPEKKPDSTEKLPQTPEKKTDSSENQGNTQPSVPKHEEKPPQGETKGETKGEAPKKSEPQNNGGNPPPNKNTGGHNEHKEMP